MKPTPVDWPRISASVFYDDPRAAIDFLCKAFGFRTRLLIEGEAGRIEHSELDYGDGLIMVGQAGKEDQRENCQPMKTRSPRAVDGAVTQALAVFVDDADAHCEAARAAGALIAQEPITSDYGEDYWADRCYRAVDPEGHHWWFMQRVKTHGKPV
ncbi:MAG: VOC family protein [Burkholderiaceae bacterium]